MDECIHEVGEVYSYADLGARFGLTVRRVGLVGREDPQLVNSILVAVPLIFRHVERFLNREI